MGGSDNVDRKAVARDSVTSRPSFWREVVAAMADPIAVVDSNGVVLEVSDALCLMTGFDRSELIGAGEPHPYWAPEERTATAAVFTSMRAGQGSDFEVVYRRKDDHRLLVRVHASLVPDGDGNVVAILATSKDLSESRGRQQVHRAEGDPRAMVYSRFDYHTILDERYSFRFVDHFPDGLRTEDVIGKTPFDFIDAPFHAPARHALDRAFHDRTSADFECYVPGVSRWFWCLVRPIVESNRTVGVGLVAHDITERKRAEEALRHSEHRLQLALAAGEMGAFELNAQTGVFEFSATAYDILGYEPGDPDFPDTLPKFFSRLHPNDATWVPEAVATALQESARFESEYRIRRADGDYAWVHVRVREFVEAAGSRRIVGFVRDVTERKRSEEEHERLQAEIQNKQKMETLGTLAGGIAHDFNNLLVPILGNAELLLHTQGAGSPLRASLQDIVDAALRARALARRILTFGRPGDEPPERVRVPHVTREVLRLVRGSLPSNVEVTTEISDDIPDVWGSTGQVHQAITNLYTNAYQALKDVGGHVRIRVARASIDESFAAAHGMRAGAGVLISVEDDGPGIAPKIRDRIFEPFFTTKADGEGMGLGLSVVHAIVQRHGGTVRVQSAPGAGARFELYLPGMDPARMSDGPRIEPSSFLSTVRARVLCVDDDEAVLRAVDAMLSHGGHVVTLASSALEALERLRYRPEDFDLVVTDQTMPRMTGIELANELLVIRADLPVIVASGYGEADRKENHPPNVRAVLSKPLTFRDLLATVGETMAQTFREARNAS